METEKLRFLVVAFKFIPKLVYAICFYSDFLCYDIFNALGVPTPIA